MLENDILLDDVDIYIRERKVTNIPEHSKFHVSIVMYDHTKDYRTGLVRKKSSDRSYFGNAEKNLTLISFATRDAFLS
jgi:hypothetical protein